VTQPRLTVTAAIIERDGTYLLAKRKPGGPRGGRWEFPGGKLEPGETDEQALTRELHEELGVGCTVGRPEPSVIYDYPDIAVELRPYRVTVTGEPVPLEHDALAWVPREGLLDTVLCGADVQIARRIVADGE
jgi:mutator protein MutT